MEEKRIRAMRKKPAQKDSINWEDTQRNSSNLRRSYDDDIALKARSQSRPEQTIQEMKDFIQNPEPTRLPYIRNLVRTMPYGRMFSDDIFEMARQKDPMLFSALEEDRTYALRQLLGIRDNIRPLNMSPYNSMRALQFLLHNQPNFISNQSLVDIFSAYPNIVNEIMTIKVEVPRKPEIWNSFMVLPPTEINLQPTGNTLLHQLIIEKRLDQIKAYLSAIFQAKLSGVSIPFDAEKKNQDNKTILQLALASGIPGIVSAVLVYANPDRTAHDVEILGLHINTPDIMRQQENLHREITSANNRRQQAMSIAAQRTDKNVIMLAFQQQVMSEDFSQLAQLTFQNHSGLIALEQQVSLALPYAPPALLEYTPPALLESKDPSVYSKRNTPALFPPPKQNEPVAAPLENPTEELRSIRTQINSLTSNIHQQLEELAVLKQRVAILENNLSTNENGSAIVMHTTRAS